METALAQPYLGLYCSLSAGLYLLTLCPCVEEYYDPNDEPTANQPFQYEVSSASAIGDGSSLGLPDEAGFVSDLSQILCHS